MVPNDDLDQAWDGAAHPEWEHFVPDDDDDDDEPITPEPPPAPPVRRLPEEQWTDLGQRCVARFVPELDGFNTIELAPEFEFSC